MILRYYINSVINDAKYVGYMFGGVNGTNSTKRIDIGLPGYEDSFNFIYNETSSTIKNALDNWYKINIKDKNFDKYVADTIFCNDRNLGYGLGYGTTNCNFGLNLRVFDAPDISPLLKCSNKNDSFTVSDSFGNKQLEFPVGLLTNDEQMAAGSGTYGKANNKYFLYKGVNSWTMSPAWVDSNSKVSFVKSDGSIWNIWVNNSYVLAPVINIKSSYISKIEGNGTITNPYQIKNVEQNQ